MKPTWWMCICHLNSSRMRGSAQKRSCEGFNTPVAKIARREISTPGDEKDCPSSVRRSGRIRNRNRCQLSPAGPTSPSIAQTAFQTPQRKRKTLKKHRGFTPKKIKQNKEHKKHGEVIACIEENGFKFRVGDHAYVVLNEEELLKVDEDNEPCAKCMKTSPDLGQMIECDQCLAGYHFDCLDPPITEVPECEWFCPVCEMGGVHPKRPPITYREVFLGDDNTLAICLIEEMWTEGSANFFSGPRYIRPEATLCGRQASNGAREIFKLDFPDDYEAERLIRHVDVHLSSEFNKIEGLGDDDVFYAQMEYSFTTEKFRQLNEVNLQSDESSIHQDDSDEYTPAEERTGSRLGSIRGRSSLRGLLERQGGGKSDCQDKLCLLSLPDLSDVEEEDGEGVDLDGDIYQRAKSALSLTTLPKCLLCRDGEKQEIQEFIDRFASAGRRAVASQCLYICGVPGTGKTATVLETIHRCTYGRLGVEKKPQFKFIEMNCFQLPSPQHFYSHLLRGITDESHSPQNALQQLSQYFTDRANASDKDVLPILVLVDEMDALITKNQKVLYNLSEWCSAKGSRLGVIGIANTLDLPERLHPRIKSRMGHQRMCFKPYSREQMTKIIRHRLRNTPTVFDDLAIKMAAAKVSGINGDVRRALELLRLAIDVYHDDKDKDKGQSVMIHHVQSTIVIMFRTPMKQVLYNTSPLEKVILSACVLGSRITGKTEAESGEIVQRVVTLLDNAMIPSVTPGVVLAKIAGMGDRRLLIHECAQPRLWQKVALNVAHEDVLAAIQQEESLSWLHRVLGLDSSV